MSRINGIDPDQAPIPVSKILQSQKENWGTYLKPYLVYSRRPSIVQAVTQMWDALSQSALLPTTLTSLVCRRIASINGCVF